MNPLLTCYCGNQLPFNKCCEPFINGSKQAQTAEQLMRSRYSAFSANQYDYLVNSHWPIDLDNKRAIQQTIESTRWLGLRVLDCVQGQPNDKDGSVEFIAFFTDVFSKDNTIQQLHERSRFQQIDGRWFYLDGESLAPVKLGRNDRCFCGSGKKFKKCHGA